MSPSRRTWVSRGILGTVAGVLITGTAGFMWIEGWSPFDAFYMTVVTLSTVGFGEVRPLSPPGRLFTIFLIFGGVAALSFGLRALGERVVEAPKRRIERRIRRMKNHTVICGYGRIAEPIVEGLRRLKRPFCVIERSAEKVEALSAAGTNAIVGDATAEEVLETAGVRRAEAVAALLPSDGDNLSITMTATALHPSIRVVARSEEERSRANLERAGAKHQDVVAPYTTAGQLLLRHLAGPPTARLILGLNEIALGEFDARSLTVSQKAALAGQTLANAAFGGHHNILVLAVKREGAVVTIAPSGDYRIRGGDTLILIGHRDDLQQVGAHEEA